MKKELVVVTGGNSGLGKELVSLFKNEFQVLVISRSKKSEYNGVFYEYGNLSDENFIVNIYKKYSSNYVIKYLINNAASGRFGAPETNTLARINEVMSAGLIGLILNTTYAIPLLDINGSKIVNILSTAALKGNINESLYCAAKWGARGYTESLKATYKGSKVKVISVCPGGMNTEFWQNNRDYVQEEKSNKWMSSKNVAEVIYNNITNENLCVSEIVIERV